MIPADKSDAVFHTKTYHLNALNASTVYEMTVTARNQFGSSDNSRIVRFSTPGKSELIKNAIFSNSQFLIYIRFLCLFHRSRWLFESQIWLDSVVDGVNNAPGGLNENDMNYDEYPFNNEIYNSAYNVATRASMSMIRTMLCSFVAAMVVVFPVTHFNVPLQLL